MEPLKIILTFFLISATWSCSLTRNVQKSKSDTNLDESIERSLKRRGDTVVYKTQVHLKDTTIYTVNRYGTTLKTVYDSNGNIAQTDCYASAMDMLEKITRNLQQSESTKDKQENARMSDTLILGIIGGVVVIVCFGFCVVIWYLNKNTSAVTAVLKNIG